VVSHDRPDRWLCSRQAATLFAVAACLVLVTTPAFLGWMDTSRMAASTRFGWDALGAAGAVGLFYIWFGMWRYWLKLDTSHPQTKRLWFIILLVGFWWASVLYFLAIYVPQRARRNRSKAE
jgi:hypothetical protein